MTTPPAKWLLAILASLALGSSAPAIPAEAAPGIAVNDVHSRLNETRVSRIVTPDSIEAIQAVVRAARAEGRAISIAGGRHAMGGQQFGAGTILLDTGRLDKVVGFDAEKGFLVVQAGIRWPELLEQLQQRQIGKSPQWGSGRSRPAPIASASAGLSRRTRTGAGCGSSR